MRRFWIAVVLGVAVAATSAPKGAAGAADGADEDLLRGTREAFARAEGELAVAAEPVARVRLLLAAGRPDEAASLVPSLSKAGSALAWRVFEAVHDTDALARLAETAAREEGHPADRALLYRWAFLRDDLPRVRELTERYSGVAPVDDLAAGRLALALLDREGAESAFQAALASARNGSERGEALGGLSRTAFKRRDWEGALSFSREALAETPLDADRLTELSDTLIRLGRTDEAIAAVELAVRIAPYHERAHYFLGNGYARKNYTQLYAAYPKVFARGGALSSLKLADLVGSNGFREKAKGAYLALAASSPNLADVQVRLGSLAFEAGDMDAAKARFLWALELCPEYGRAHNGLAKVLEARRLAIDVHHDAYEAAFAAAPMPEIPRIDQFVVNWNSLSARHQKRVALSVEPWKRYLPVLIESGCTYYIKPLHELLSETPGQETLRDQRISYDSRLWDDVRGCGGYHTVTGVEDVERTVFGRYNTVLHELSHQVHAVLTRDRKESIQELYRAAKARDAAGDDAFLSRYAGSSVWEYLAEGANALETPIRDRFDTKEIVKERLEALDPKLESLVRELMERADIESTYAVAFANRGDDRLERGEPLEAVRSYRQALRRAPGEETALAAMIHALVIADSTDAALDRALDAALLAPQGGELAVRRAEALWFGGYGLATAVDALASARAGVRESERYLVDLSLGDLYLVQGDATRSLAAYARVLDYQADNPEALWGTAAAEARAGNREAAWKRYDEAVRRRTGVVDLRAAYAFDLLRAGEAERAEAQIAAARLLDDTDPVVTALRGWARLGGGDASGARDLARRALEAGPWCDLARVVAARAALAMGEAEEAAAMLSPLHARIAAESPPDYVYDTRRAGYRRVHDLPASLRDLVAETPLPEGTNGN